MDAKQIAGALLGTIIKICIGIAVIYLVYEVGIGSYNFGYRVFADLPMDVSPGIDKQVTIVAGKTPMEIGQILEDKGVVRDGRVFFVQELLSESHGKLKPGAYTLNTSMNGAEIIAVLSGQTPETEEGGEEADSKAPAKSSGAVVGELQDNAGGVDHTSEMTTEEELQGESPEGEAQ